MNKKLVKWGIIIGVALVVSGLNAICAKAQAEPARGGRGASPDTTPQPATPAPSPTADLWEDFQTPDWLATEFAFHTPSPTRAPAEYAPAEIVLDDDASLQGFDSDWQYKSYLNLWYQYLSNGDSSVWYFKSMTQTQIAVGSSSLYRPYSPWRDNVGYTMFTEQNYLRFLNGSNAAMHTTFNYGGADVSISDYNISFFDVANLANSHQVPANYRIIYYFALNKLYPKFYNSPTWFAEIGLTEDLLYDLMVTPSVEIVLKNGISQTLIYDPISLRQLYSGYTFDLDLNSIFVGSDSSVSEFRFNFSIPFFSGDWIGMQKYRQYLVDHPEITGHIPFYIYWDSSSSASQSGKGVFTFFRGYAISEKQSDRNWLARLFTPTAEGIEDIFSDATIGIWENGGFAYVAEFKAFLFNTLVQPGASESRDVTLTIPSIDIPIGNNQTAHVSNSYTYNFSQTLRDIGIEPWLRLAMNIMITAMFINSYISLAVSIFHIHYFDGV